MSPTYKSERQIPLLLRLAVRDDCLHSLQRQQDIVADTPLPPALERMGGIVRLCRTKVTSVASETSDDQ